MVWKAMLLTCGLGSQSEWGESSDRVSNDAHRIPEEVYKVYGKGQKYFCQDGEAAHRQRRRS